MTLRKLTYVFFAFLGLYIATAGGHLYSPDEEIMFRMTESLARHGTLAVEPMLDAQGNSFATRRGVDGKEYPQYGIGNSLFAVPLYWLGEALTKVIPDEKAKSILGFRTVMYIPETSSAPGHDLLRRFTVSFFGSIVAALTATLLWAFTFTLCSAESPGEKNSEDTPENPRKCFSPTLVAWLVSIAYGAGTMALPHARTFFSEPLATLFVGATFYVLARPWRSPLLFLFLAGVFYALALLTRLDSAVVAPAVGLFLALRFLEESPEHATLPLSHLDARTAIQYFFSRPFFARLLAFSIGPVLFLLLHVTLNWIHFGNPLTSAYADQPEGIQFRTPLLAGLYGYFMSIGKSVFLFSPAVVFGLLGWRSFLRQNLSLGVSLLLAVILLLIFHSRWQNWTGGWCWGPRHIFMAHLLTLIPSIGFFTAWSRAGRWLFCLLMPIAFAVQLYGASQNFVDFYILYYRTPETMPNAYVMYSTEDLKPIKAIAPINDSIYVPQNSQWYRYAEMWQLGYVDNLWLRLLNRTRGSEPPVR
jgi:hypothetical protein